MLFSDWIEQCILNIRFGAMQLFFTTGLIHRINVILKIFEERSPVIRKGKYFYFI